MMNNLPNQLHWAIENAAGQLLDTLYWRKICTLAHALSTPVMLLNALNSPKFIDGLLLSKKELAETHELHEKDIQQQLTSLQRHFLEKKVEVSFNVLTERPFFEATINLARQKEHAWVIVQSSKNKGIPNIVWQFIRDCPVPLYIAKEKDWQLPLNILAAIDPTHENDKSAARDHAILATAADIAQQCQAKLHVMHCYSPMILTSEHSLQAHLENLHREHFREAIHDYYIDSNRAHLLAGDPAEKIKELSQTLDIDLVIMGAVSRNSIERIFVGGTTEEVIPTIESDLLLIKS